MDEATRRVLYRVVIGGVSFVTIGLTTAVMVTVGLARGQGGEGLLIVAAAIVVLGLCLAVLSLRVLRRGR